MSDAWKPVLEKLKGTMIAEIKAEIGQVDLSGNIVQDVLSIADAVLDSLAIADKYADEIEVLSPEDQRELFIHGIDPLIKLPAWAEGFDDNVLGWVYDWAKKGSK